ncbi:hypothetical protein DVS28_b0255 (plasmid) [Euzebya pacifica]|uniref:Uncharacterized protein n=1 Tax=Euzebya pacifica TaxID=1608957 RepID=A0A346Y6C8_9ACTN|nr:hypothetical protein DVS28_b0255 [Euzebya pacifica]
MRRRGDCGGRQCPRSIGAELVRHAELGDDTGLLAQAFNDPFTPPNITAAPATGGTSGSLTSPEAMAAMITAGYDDDDGDRRAVVDTAATLEAAIRSIPTAALIDAAWADTPLAAALADGPGDGTSGFWTRTAWGEWTRHPGGSAEPDDPGTVVFHPGDTKDLRALSRQVRRDAVHRLVQLWAVDPTGHPQTRAMQRIAADAMARDPRGFTPDPALTGRDKVYAELLAAQYDHTQRWLADRGIEWVTLHRGESATGRGYRRHPMASWTTEEWVADWHATGSLSSGGTPGSERVATADIPARDIMSVPTTGMGTMTEYEVVVLSRVRPDRAAVSGRAA